MLMLKPEYFGYLMRTTNLLEKTLMLGKTEGRRRRDQPRVRWHHQFNGDEFEQTKQRESLTDTWNIPANALLCTSKSIVYLVSYLHYFFYSPPSPPPPTFFFSFFGPHCVACGIFVHQSGIEPGPPELEAGSLNHWLPGISLYSFFFFFIYLFIYSTNIYWSTSKQCAEFE